MLTIEELKKLGADTDDGLQRCMNDEGFYLGLVKTVLEDEIKMAMGQAETLVSPTGAVMAMWKNTKATQKFNAKAFLEADPSGYAKYLETTQPGRRFSVK